MSSAWWITISRPRDADAAARSSFITPPMISAPPPAAWLYDHATWRDCCHDWRETQWLLFGN